MSLPNIAAPGVVFSTVWYVEQTAQAMLVSNSSTISGQNPGTVGIPLANNSVNGAGGENAQKLDWRGNSAYDAGNSAGV